MLRWLFASAHLLGLGIGLGAIWVRAQALQGAPDPACVRRALQADMWWGIAALLWFGTGLSRVLMGMEKPTAYYLANHLFWLKMGLFGIVFLLEMGPMMAFGHWRRALRRGQPPDTTRAPRWAVISRVQTAIVVAILFTATAMARGYGSP